MILGKIDENNQNDVHDTCKLHSCPDDVYKSADRLNLRTYDPQYGKRHQIFD